MAPTYMLRSWADNSTGSVVSIVGSRRRSSSACGVPVPLSNDVNPGFSHAHESCAASCRVSFREVGSLGS